MSFSEYEADTNYQYNRAQTLVFLDLMNRLMHSTYEKRLEIVKETWGEIKEFPKIFYYGDYCFIKIYKESEKIRFNFECSQVNLDVLQQGNADFAKAVEDKFIKLKEEEEKNNIEENDSEENTQTSDDKSLNNDYINLYRNIKFKN